MAIYKLIRSTVFEPKDIERLVAAYEQTLRALERKVLVDQAPVTLPPITVSESGYIEAPHKNKYGKDYPPVIEDRAIYPAGRNP